MMCIIAGTSVDQLACVRFGLITPDTKLEDLVQMVFATGRNIEESSKACYYITYKAVVKLFIDELTLKNLCWVC